MVGWDIILFKKSLSKYINYFKIVSRRICGMMINNNRNVSGLFSISVFRVICIAIMR